MKFNSLYDMWESFCAETYVITSNLVDIIDWVQVLLISFKLNRYDQH